MPQIIDPISKTNVAKSSYKYILIINKFKYIREKLNKSSKDNVEKLFNELFFN